MSICARVIVSVPFHEVHNAPNTKARADGNNESLQNGNSLIEEFHSRFSPDCSIDKKHDSKRKTGWHIFGAACSCNSGFNCLGDNNYFFTFMEAVVFNFVKTANKPTADYSNGNPP